MLVAEQIIVVLAQLYFFKPVHVQLSDEGVQIVMFEVEWEHLGSELSRFHNEERRASLVPESVVLFLKST